MRDNARCAAARIVAGMMNMNIFFNGEPFKFSSAKSARQVSIRDWQ